MKSTIFLIIFCILLTFILGLIFFLLQTKNKETKEEKTAFECGFLSSDKSQKTFSISYFYMTIIFLIFDLEILILAPMVIFKSSSSSWCAMLIITLYFSLILSLEWNNNMLEWNN